MKDSILVTPRSLTRTSHPSVDLLRENGYDVIAPAPGIQPSEDDLLRLLPGCVGYLAGVERVSARVIEAATGLRAISRNGVGIDSIDAAAASRAGVRILTTPGANAQGVAELALATMFALARSLPATDAALKAGQWVRHIGVELDGATLGVVGLGSVGRRVATMALSIGMNVLGYDPVPPPGFPPEGRASAEFRMVGLDALFAGSRVVTLHCPPSDEPIVDARVLGLMRAGSLLVNTARAGLVDADAVLAALESGRLGGYGVDVFSEEPPQDRRLVEHPGVIATSHIGGYTRESVDRAAFGAAENLISALREADG